MSWEFSTPGIPDELFERDELVPITKEDIRSLVISKLRLKHGFTAIDIGCGSGSITVDSAFRQRGIIYTVSILTKEP